ncbi:hypothetical protein SMSP2_01453 [Limihaloglobus sulfuriphilus]|uniref:Ice-binding protein C-terminal domain-containing protein n=1 Tax=Limihaloglobus sulfuriphilus TaxID=1851148 RepID=A0A1Q2MEK9_9BACT|nr:PEP-CTERM sorting domain-containing protein [Limihaloglobus sulfuriphilus]AQQ71089.1 hypothetical protein SMSP2_01453 [Limihaloglobus sulfuriphilus]
MKKYFVLLILVFGMSLISNAATDPVWLGDDYTVGAGWDTWGGGFGFGNGAISPDFFDVIPNEALAYVDGPDVVTGASANYLATYNNSFDVIEVWNDADLDFWVPNFSQTDNYTEMWVQVTYEPFEDVAPSFNVETNNTFDNPLNDRIYGPILEKSETNADGWVTDAFSFVLEPAAECVWLTLNFNSSEWDAYPMYVDAVTVDMVNVPEPATFIIFGAGLALLRKKKLN